MMSDESIDEFLEDFGAPGLTDAELVELLVRAQESGDSDVRRLVKSLQHLRFWVRELLLPLALSGGTLTESHRTNIEVVKRLVQFKDGSQ